MIQPCCVRLYRSVSEVPYLSFAILAAAALHREFVQHGQQVEGLLRLEGEQVQVHQQEAHGLSKPLCRWKKTG